MSRRMRDGKHMSRAKQMSQSLHLGLIVACCKTRSTLRDGQLAEIISLLAACSVTTPVQTLAAISATAAGVQRGYRMSRVMEGVSR